MTDSGLLAGRLSDMGLGEFVMNHSSVFRSLPYVIVSAVDSETRTAAMPWAQERIGRESSWAKALSPLVISGTDLVDAARESVFNGFDEIWVVPVVSKLLPPDEASLVAPRRLDDGVPDGVASWMRDSGAQLGLGDGDGLNYVARDLGLAIRLGLMTEG